MEITLQQPEVELALKNYLKTMGINRTVSEINFTQSRKGGASTVAEITLQALGDKPLEVDEVADDNPFVESKAEEPAATEETTPEVVEEEPASTSIFG